MKMLFENDLIRNPNGTISWYKNVGRSVRFLYDDIKDSVNITDYECKNKQVKIQVEYNGKQRWMSTGSFKRCNFGCLLGIKNDNHIYVPGAILFEQFKILSLTRVVHNKNKGIFVKGYTCNCLKCGHTFDISEQSLKQFHNCQACCLVPKVLVKGVNDLRTKYPNLAVKLYDKVSADKILYNSQIKLNWKCDYCSKIIEGKTIENALKFGTICNYCKDGFSYPEKTFRELLILSNLNFEMHVKFEWSEGKEYDFYLPDYDCIVEIHGAQHFDKNGFSNMGGRTLLEEQLNDEHKSALAKKHISNYIVINARLSDFEFISTNIINSYISNFINFSTISISQWHKNTLSSYVYEVSKLWNNGFRDYDSLINKTKLSKCVIKECLKKGASANLCDYTNKSMMIEKRQNNKVNLYTKRVRCITTNEIFNSLTIASKVHNVSIQTISRACSQNGRRGGFSCDKQPLYWEFVEGSLI